MSLHDWFLVFSLFSGLDNTTLDSRGKNQAQYHAHRGRKCPQLWILPCHLTKADMRHHRKQGSIPPVLTSRTHLDLNACQNERHFLFGLWGSIGVEHAFQQKCDGQELVDL